MNEHTGTVILCRESAKNPDIIVTVSQNHEYKEWSYTSGAVKNAYKLNLPENDQIIVADISR